MTRAEYARALRGIEKSNRAWQDRAEREIRELYRQALREWHGTGVWNDAELRRKIAAVYAAGVYAAAEKAGALALEFFGAAADDPRVRQAARRAEPSASAWGTEEAKARAKAAAECAASAGMGREGQRRVLDALCEPQGGKKAARKIGRLFRVKSGGGEIVESRWREGWERDWLERSGHDVPYSKDPGSEFQRLFRKEGGAQWADAHGYGARGRMLLPKAHKDFVKRLGSQSIDYRAARIARTESQRALNETLERIGTGPLASGKFEVQLGPRRDACRICEAIAEDSKGGVTLEELKAIAVKRGGGSEEYGYAPPWHPNCGCWLLPTALPPEEAARRAAERNCG